MEDHEFAQQLPNYDGRLRIQNAILNHTDQIYVIDYFYFFQMKVEKQLNLLSCTVPYDGCINFWGPRTIAVDQNNEVYIVDGINRDSEGIFKLNGNERTLVIGGGEIPLEYFEERRDQIPLSDIHFGWINHFQVNQSEFTVMVPLGYYGELNGQYGDSFVCKIDMQGNIRYYQNLLTSDSTNAFIQYDSDAILVYKHGARDYSIYYHHIEQSEPKLLVEIEAQVLIREHGMYYDGQADNLYIVTYDYLNNEWGESEGQYFVWKIPNIRSLISSSVYDWHDYQ